MGDKNSYFPSLRGCQAISEIKQVGSSSDTRAPMPRQAFSPRGVWVYTQARSQMRVRLSTAFDVAVCETLLPGLGRTCCYRALTSAIQFFPEHILRLSNDQRQRRGGLVASSTKKDSAILFGSPQRCLLRNSLPLTGAWKLKVSLEYRWLSVFKTAWPTFPVLSSFISCLPRRDTEVSMFFISYHILHLCAPGPLHRSTPFPLLSSLLLQGLAQELASL